MLTDIVFAWVILGSIYFSLIATFDKQVKREVFMMTRLEAILFYAITILAWPVSLIMRYVRSYFV